MKKNQLIFTVLLAGAFSVNAFAQKETKEKKVKCDDIKISVIKGDVNGLEADATMEEVKKEMPCFTGDSEEGSDMNCGGGVFYLDKNFFFYTGKDYFEARTGYLGKVDVVLFDQHIKQANDYFTKPVKTVTDATGINYFYKQRYGTVVLHTNMEEVIDKIQIWKSDWDQVVLCN